MPSDARGMRVSGQKVDQVWAQGLSKVGVTGSVVADPRKDEQLGCS